MKTLYAKTKATLQLFIVCSAALLLAACAANGGGFGSFSQSEAPSGYVTKDPDSIPDIAWQTNMQRRTLSKEAQAVEGARPSLQTVEGVAGVPRKVTVSILLPLTGKHAELGQSMLKAAQMALFDVGSANYELVPHDTKSTTQGAIEAAHAAAGGKSSLILGPIFAEDLRVVRPIATSANIPVVAFTTDWTQGGNGTYIMGFMPFNQVSRVAKFAQTRGYDKIAVLAPQTEYCDVVIEALSRSGVSIAHIQRYATSQSDLSAIASDFLNQSKAVQFNALMLPVGGESLRTLVSTLDAVGATNDSTKFIGTGLWDDDSLARNPGVYGGWFAAPDPALRRDFEKRYQENYGAAPIRLASLAYDATALSAVLARNGGNDPYSRDRMTHPRGFAGIDGIFRFRGDGMNERGLAILEVQGGGKKVIDPAPTAFITPGM